MSVAYDSKSGPDDITSGTLGPWTRMGGDRCLLPQL